MKWKGRAGSRNVEDRRGRGVGGPVLAGGGIGGLLIVLLITFLGGDPGAILGDGGGASTSEPYVAS
ncbi:neutral zinc metallopeptidase, partial [Streptococcus pneumoniae]|nr:neutral zinc metallopeptidase [Streptococcus pneumoniae]